MFKLIVCSPHGAPVSCKLNTKISFSPSTLTKWVKQIHSLFSVFPHSLSHFFSLCLTRSLFLLIKQAGQASATYSLQICGTGSPPFLIFERFMMTHFAINQISHWTDGQLFQKVENDENRFFAITSSKLVRNWFCKKHLLRNNIFHNYCFLYVL